jgi:peptidoglycan/xylan/chitin deacetylase (PgdA/CDA1 family)
MVPALRLVIFSSKRPEEIGRLLDRLPWELVDARVCGVLYEKRPRESGAHRIRAILRKLPQPGYLRYASRQALCRIPPYVSSLIDAAIRFLHACPREPNSPSEISLSDLGHRLQQQGCELFVTPDVHSTEVLAFVERQKADLGVAFGTSLLPCSLFKIPRFGSISLDGRRDPDGGRPVGLQELLDNRDEITVAVHKIEEQLDAMPVLRAATIPIGCYDNLESLALKAEVVGNDLLVAAIADYMAGNAQPSSQVGQPKQERSPSEQQMLISERELRQRRPRYSAKRTRPVWKLLVRTIFLLSFAVIRNWFYRWRKAFPVVVFYHHVITDRPHHLGTPTAVFASQIAFLRRFYRIASLEQAMQMLRQGSVPMPTVVLTFDDGYGDNFVNLRAVAEHYNIPVFLFLSTARIGSGSPFGHDVKREQSGFTPLSWNQVTTLSRSGFSFGCHTRSHFDCGSRDMRLLEEEIAGSKRELGSRAGIWADHFAFPWGMPENMSHEAQRLASETFPYVFAAAGGVNVVGTEPRGALLRRENHPSNLWEVELAAQCLLNMRTWRDLFPGIF